MIRINLNAWREIVTRVMEEFTPQINVIPDWLINPATNRKLKLDYLYPEIGVAVRFEGLKAKEQRRRDSLEDELKINDRELARQIVCAEHGISLASLNLSTSEFDPLFLELEMALSHSARKLKQNTTLSPQEKETLLNKISIARSKVNQFRKEIQTDKALDLYAALWNDRQYRVDSQPDEAEARDDVPPFEIGMLVEHIRFGVGQITALVPGNTDQTVTIDFVDHGQRTFLASLLADKLIIEE